MRTIKTTLTNQIIIKNIVGYFEHQATRFGTGAKIDCPKEYLGKKVVVLVRRD